MTPKHPQHHANHHRLIDDRVGDWRETPKREVVRRRDTGKRALHTVVGHLRCCHGWRANSLGMSIDDVLNVHKRLHNQEKEQA
jgi:hypothetical protein